MMTSRTDLLSEFDHLQRVIVMEGPDRCGKTNLGLALAYRFRAPYFKVSSEPQNWRRENGFKLALEYDQTYIAEFLKQTGVHCTIDRAWPSEWVYSRVFGRETNEHCLKRVDEIHSQIGTTIVLCQRREPPSVWDDELVDEEMFIEISFFYDKFMEWTMCNVVRIDVDTYDNRLDQIEALEKPLTACLMGPPTSRKRFSLVGKGKYTG